MGSLRRSCQCRRGRAGASLLLCFGCRFLRTSVVIVIPLLTTVMMMHVGLRVRAAGSSLLPTAGGENSAAASTPAAAAAAVAVVYEPPIATLSVCLAAHWSAPFSLEHCGGTRLHVALCSASAWAWAAPPMPRACHRLRRTAAHSTQAHRRQRRLALLQHRLWCSTATASAVLVRSACSRCFARPRRGQPAVAVIAVQLNAVKVASNPCELNRAQLREPQVTTRTVCNKLSCDTEGLGSLGLPVQSNNGTVAFACALHSTSRTPDAATFPQRDTVPHSTFKNCTDIPQSVCPLTPAEQNTEFRPHMARRVQSKATARIDAGETAAIGASRCVVALLATAAAAAAADSAAAAAAPGLRACRCLAVASSAAAAAAA